MDLREEASQILTQKFGEPETLETSSGLIYRWRLPRKVHDVYVMLDSPELPHIIHLLVSDPAASAVQAISSHVLHSLTELRATMDGIENRWRSQ